MAARTPQSGRRPAARKSAAWSKARGRGVGSLWMALANGVGWLVRGMSSQAAKATGLDPEHRRDGAGLFLIGLSILLAVAIWADSAGPFGAWLGLTVRLLVGAVAAALPILFFLS